MEFVLFLLRKETGLLDGARDISPRFLVRYVRSVDLYLLTRSKRFGRYARPLVCIAVLSNRVSKTKNTQNAPA